MARNAERGELYQEFLPRSPLDRLQGLLRGSRCTRARRQADALNHAGFTAPASLAWGHLPGGREYLFSSTVAGDSITHWLRHGLTGRDPATLALRRNLLRELGTCIGRLHASGFIHGDLQPNHVLATYKGGQFRFALIENEGNLRRQPPPGKLLLGNLAQLNLLLPGDLTRSDRWRCFLSWRRQHPELGHSEARILAVEAYRRAARTLRDAGSLS